MTDFKNENVWLMQGDCLERMKEIPDGSVDAIICDPPYGTTYCKWDSIIPLEPMWKELIRIIKPFGAIVLTASQPFTSKLISSNYNMFKYVWSWEKNVCGNYMMAKFAPLKYMEDIIVFSEGGINTGCSHPVPYYPQGLVAVSKKIKSSVVAKEGINSYHSLGKSRVQKFTNYPKNKLVFDSVVKPIHSTQKPVALMEYLIKTYTKESETVLDFTMGSGATIKAALNTSRKAIGIELGQCEKKGHKYFGMDWTDVLIDQLELK